MIEISSKSRKKIDITSIIDNEVNSISSLFDTQNKYNDELLNYISDFTKNIKILNGENSVMLDGQFTILSELLEKSKITSFCLRQLSEKLAELQLDKTKAGDDFKDKITLYNRMYFVFNDIIVANLTQIQLFFEGKHTGSNNLPVGVGVLDNPIAEEQKIIEQPVKTEIINVETNANENPTVGVGVLDNPPVEIAPSCDPLIENTLTISDEKGKVILPYTIKNLNEEKDKNPDKYKTVQDVIDDLYTRPLEMYKKSSSARFKEAFKLIKEREGKSFIDALDIAFEVFLKYSLHPAIITACKNLDELDIYLSCLEYNELEDFNCFKIEFNSLPTAGKKIKKALKKGKELSNAKTVAE